MMVIYMPIKDLIKRKEYGRQHYLLHKEEHNKWGKIYYQTHKEKIKKQTDKYRQTHKEEIKEKHRKEYINNREKILCRSNNYRLTHKEQTNRNHRKWDKINPDKRLKIYTKHRDKRKRGLGYIPINKWFKGSEGHHLTKEYVMYIPKELHRLIRHNIFTGKNMNLINYEVYKWYNGLKPQSLYVSMNYIPIDDLNVKNC